MSQCMGSQRIGHDLVNKLTYYFSLVSDIQHIDPSIKYLENNLHYKPSNHLSPHKVIRVLINIFVILYVKTLK